MSPDQITDGTSAKSFNFGRITGLQLDSKGNVFFATQYYILRIDTLGNIHRVAGNYASQDSRDGQLATDTRLFMEYFRIRKDDQIFITDYTEFSTRIRSITADERIATVAGSTDFVASPAFIGGAAQSVRLQRFLFSFDSEGNPAQFVEATETDPTYGNLITNWYLVSIKRNAGVISADGRKRYIVAVPKCP